jgi:hypothetical protein
MSIDKVTHDGPTLLALVRAAYEHNEGSRDGWTRNRCDDAIVIAAIKLLIPQLTDNGVLSVAAAFNLPPEPASYARDHIANKLRRLPGRLLPKALAYVIAALAVGRDEPIAEAFITHMSEASR